MKKLYLLLIILSLFSLSTSANVHVVDVSDNVFTPPSINVIVGDTIQWKWLQGTHTTTSTSVPTGAAAWDAPINSGSIIYNYQVQVAGTYNYHCSFHPGMTGSFTASAVGVPEFSSEQTFNWSIADNDLTVTLNLNRISNLRIHLYTMLGRDVKELASLQNFQGSFEETFSIAGLPKGIYFLQVVAGNKKAVKKIIIE
jgi:plastocyanin